MGFFGGGGGTTTSSTPAPIFSNQTTADTKKDDVAKAEGWSNEKGSTLLTQNKDMTATATDSKKKATLGGS